ncbi:hypothetical protein [Streptomyces sp. NPDC015345]|uniref:ATP-binding protein n=1 Tax=Streptomyces sp. NPDC015345 TaxID=3364953 RepID=UPI0036F7BFAA
MGRAEELAALRRLLAQGRLVTVVGGAGIGKSLLAEHAAAAVGGSLPDGVVRVRWWDGAPARRRRVAQTVAEALDGEVGPGMDAAGGGIAVGVADIAARLRSRRMLLVLDDFDPVRGECVRLVRALLEEAPDVRVLAAGRHPLGLGDEAVLRLGPLAVVGDGGWGAVAGGAGPDAVTGSAGPDAVTADPKPDAVTGDLRSNAVTADARPHSATGHPRPDTDTGRSEPNTAAGHAEPHADARHARPDTPAADPNPDRLARPGAPAASGGGSEAGPAVALFLERVRAARRGRARAGGEPGAAGAGGEAGSGGAGGDPSDVRVAREICRRLEGVPLAIELAAAQAADHSLAQLARMLESARGWPGTVDAPLRRHRSLRAAVGAGYALCGTEERTVWARLSVFAGDFDEDAAAFVCGGGGLGAQDVPAALARLVLASVVEPVRDPGGVLSPRFRLSAAVRGFGAERLESAGEAAAAISRHLYWYGHVASTAHHLWSTGLHERAVALVRDEEADLRAALARRPSGADQASMALTLAVDLWFWWALCGNAPEGREHLLRLLPLGRTDTLVRRQALWLAGWLAVCTGSPDAAETLGQAWRVALLAGDDATVGRVCHTLGALALDEGRTERAIAHLREAADTLPAHAEYGPPVAVSWALLAVAQARVAPGDATRSIRRASAGPQPRHDLWTRSMTQYAQALVDHVRGRRSRAWRRAHKALAGALGLAGAARARATGGGGAALLAQEATGAADTVALPAVTTMAGPPGPVLVHQLIADIEAGRT